MCMCDLLEIALVMVGFLQNSYCTKFFNPVLNWSWD